MSLFSLLKFPEFHNQTIWTVVYVRLLLHNWTDVFIIRVTKWILIIGSVRNPSLRAVYIFDDPYFVDNTASQIHTDLFHVQVGAVVYCHPRVTIIIRTISRPWRIVFHKRVMIFLAARWSSCNMNWGAWIGVGFLFGPIANRSVVKREEPFVRVFMGP